VMAVIAVMIAAYGSSPITFYLLLSWIVSLTIAYYFNPSRRLSEELRNEAPLSHEKPAKRTIHLSKSPDHNTKGAIENA
jgi:hypothetical protein